MNVGSLERSGAGDENWEGWRFLPSRSQPVKEGGSAASEPGYQWAILSSLSERHRLAGIPAMSDPDFRALGPPLVGPVWSRVRLVERLRSPTDQPTSGPAAHAGGVPDVHTWW
jgi:hypothetical protein